MTHASSRISALRSVALNVPNLEQAVSFFCRTWHLFVADRAPGVVYLRGTGQDHHLLALHQGGEHAQIKHVTLRAHSESALREAAVLAEQYGGRVVKAMGPSTDAAGGVSVRLVDAHGRVFELVTGDTLRSDPTEETDQPIRLAHVVLNSHDVEESQKFLARVLDFSLSDRTKIMAFMRCNSDHHSIALGDTDNDALNHIAFLMPDLDSVMRGGGRMRDAGFGIEWGPGRHGPGNNAFNYFVGPFDLVIEYTAEVQQIDDSYKAGQPADWKWPEGRVDHWGISQPPSGKLKDAQRAVLFETV